MTTLPPNHLAWHLADRTGRLWWDTDRARLIAHVGATPHALFRHVGVAFGSRVPR